MAAREGWRSFEEARTFVRGLGLLGQAEWVSYCRGELELLLGTRPADIPAGPFDVYRGAGWSGWRDWLGPAPIEPVRKGYRTFKRARVFARSLKLKDAAQWRSWCAGRIASARRRPADIPEEPERMYPRAWRGWGDWLGTRRGAPKNGLRRYIAFERARAWARTLGLRSAREWGELCAGRHPEHEGLLPGVPASPGLIYQQFGWNGWGDFLGTGQYGGGEAPFFTFEETRAFVQGLHLSSTVEYFAWSAGRRPDLPPRPATIPGDPDRIYLEQGWTSWGEFLGTGNIHPTKRRFRSFEGARRFARALHLRNSDEWHAFVAGRRPELGECPLDVPHHPHMAYASRGWKGMGDFLGTGNVAAVDREFRPFDEVRSFARGLRLRSGDEWAAFARGEMPERGRLPPDVPRAPQVVFRGRGWAGWGDFLGTGNIASIERKWRAFREARRFVRGLGLTSRTEWGEFIRREALVHPDLPKDPARAYSGKGWRGWCDFLGVARRSRPRRAWRSFEEARRFARGLAFRSSHEWERWSRGDRPDLAPRPADIPGVPYVAYAKDGWLGWRDFLGTEAGRVEK